MTSSSFIFHETSIKQEPSKHEAEENDSTTWLPAWASSVLAHAESLRPQVAVLYNSTFVQIIMFIATVYALFIDDLRIVAFPKAADEGLNILLSIIFFLFLVVSP